MSKKSIYIAAARGWKLLMETCHIQVEAVNLSKVMQISDEHQQQL